MGDLWDKLEPMHAKLWREGKARYLEEIRDLRNNKLQIARVNHANKIRMYESKLIHSTEERITRMYNVLIDDENKRYELRCKSIEETASRADILVSKIANGIITVEG